MAIAVLMPHQSTPAAGIGALTVRVTLTAAGDIGLGFAVQGDLDKLHVPEPRTPMRADGLWRHTCFEVFAMAGDGPAYREFNFSPSGTWAAYAFRGYRDAEVTVMEAAPTIVVRRTPDRLELDTRLRAGCLPWQGAGTTLRLGLAAVLEDGDGTLSYWALRHPLCQPDFHHTDAFALWLDRA